MDGMNDAMHSLICCLRTRVRIAQHFSSLAEPPARLVGPTSVNAPIESLDANTRLQLSTVLPSCS